MKEEVFKEARWRYDSIKRYENLISTVQSERHPRLVAGALDESWLLDQECVDFIIEYYKKRIKNMQKEFDKL